MLVLAIAASACAARPGAVDLVPHLLHVDATGGAVRTLAPAEIAARGRVTGEALDDTALGRQVGTIMTALRRAPERRVLLHAHGGVTSHRAARALAQRLAPRVIAAGYHPVFISWDASLWSATGEHLVARRAGEDMGPVLGTLTVPLVYVGDLARSIGRAPSSWAHQLLDYCRAIHRRLRDDAHGRLPGMERCPLPGVDRARRRALAIERARLDDTSAIARDALQLAVGAHHVPWHRDAARVAIGVVTALPKLVTAPFMEGFGAGPFHALERRAVAGFLDSIPALAGQHTGTSGGARRGAIAVLLDSLAALLRADCPDRASTVGCTRRVTMAGFSMGTLVIDRALTTHPTLPVDRIIHMAAAAPVHDVAAHVVPALLRDTSVRYYGAMVHPYVESGERRALDLVPRGTLLTVTDQAWAEAMSPRDGTAGRWVNAVVTTDVFPAAVRARVRLKAFGVRDPRATRSCSAGSRATMRSRIRASPSGTSARGRCRARAVWREPPRPRRLVAEPARSHAPRRASASPSAGVRRVTAQARSGCRRPSAAGPR
ncbi:MAG: hypothetical protein MUF21_07380 [Gemmatimonadaceae bacterium]|nr:hypothetical protein [Gemmatimonadaceae bacterium]